MSCKVTLGIASFALLWTSAFSQTAPAPSGAASAAAASPPSDKTNYLSDRVKFQFATYVARVDMTSANKTVTDACAPAFTTLRGIGVLKFADQVQPAFVVASVPAQAGPCTAANIVKADDVVLIKQDDITGTPPDRYGLTYGTLLVPFKYQLSGDKSFAGRSSLGGYMGYRQDRSGLTGLAVQYVAFLGGASVPVQQTVDGKTVTQEITGVSYGLGLIGTIKENFQMGVILGADRVSKNAGYVNNGKPWLAVSLGFAFSN
jgi:hypothetical protein